VPPVWRLSGAWSTRLETARRTRLDRYVAVWVMPIPWSDTGQGDFVRPPLRRPSTSTVPPGRRRVLPWRLSSRLDSGGRELAAVGRDDHVRTGTAEADETWIPACSGGGAGMALDRLVDDLVQSDRFRVPTPGPNSDCARARAGPRWCGPPASPRPWMRNRPKVRAGDDRIVLGLERLGRSSPMAAYRGLEPRGWMVGHEVGADRPSSKPAASVTSSTTCHRGRARPRFSSGRWW